MARFAEPLTTIGGYLPTVAFYGSERIGAPNAPLGWELPTGTCVKGLIHVNQKSLARIVVSGTFTKYRRLKHDFR
jgi:hypothetical protein